MKGGHVITPIRRLRDKLCAIDRSKQTTEISDILGETLDWLCIIEDTALRNVKYQKNLVKTYKETQRNCAIHVRNIEAVYKTADFWQEKCNLTTRKWIEADTELNKVKEQNDLSR